MVLLVLASVAQTSNTVTVRKADGTVPKLLMGSWSYEGSDQRGASDTLNIARHEFKFASKQRVSEWAITSQGIAQGIRTWNLVQAHTKLVLTARETRPGWNRLLPNGLYSIERLTETELWLGLDSMGTFKYVRRTM